MGDKARDETLASVKAYIDSPDRPKTSVKSSVSGKDCSEHHGTNLGYPHEKSPDVLSHLVWVPPADRNPENLKHVVDELKGQYSKFPEGSVSVDQEYEPDWGQGAHAKIKLNHPGVKEAAESALAELKPQDRATAVDPETIKASRPTGPRSVI